MEIEMHSCRVAIIGATGAVGTVLLEIIKQRNFPLNELRLCASKRSWGREIDFDGRSIAVEKATDQLLSEVDLVFIAAGSEVSHIIAPKAVKHGAFVVDKSSAFRMDPDVPLVVPEINATDMNKHNGIVSTPNCSTTQLVMALKPLDDINQIRRVIVDTYQSVSGTGNAAVKELTTQSRTILDGGIPKLSEYPHQIAFNTLPQIETFLDNGYTTEEMKLVYETRKILNRPNLAISATCVRVPVLISHSEAVHVEFEEPIQVEKVHQLLANFPGIKIIDQPSESAYPLPINAAGSDLVYVGRIRQDVSKPNGIVFWIVSDNLRKGAALNAVQIAERALEMKLIPKKERNLS